MAQVILSMILLRQNRLVSNYRELLQWIKSTQDVALPQYLQNILPLEVAALMNKELLFHFIISGNLGQVKLYYPKVGPNVVLSDNAIVFNFLYVDQRKEAITKYLIDHVIVAPNKSKFA